MAPTLLSRIRSLRYPLLAGAAALLLLGAWASGGGWWDLPAPAESPFGEDDEVPDVVAAFEYRLDPATVRAGEHLRLIVTAQLAEGWYIYSLEEQGEFAPPPTLMTVDAAGLVVQGIPYEVNPTVKVDPVFDMTLAFHKPAARFYQNFQAPPSAPAGEMAVHAAVRYQTCNSRLCLPAITEKITAALEIEEGPVRPPFAFMQRTVDYLAEDGRFVLNADTLEEALSQGLLAFLMLAVGFGLLALVTPCVFPMIPITISFFTAAAKERDGSMVKLALLFGLGIVVMYTGLGLLLTFLLGAAGTSQFATNPWVNLVVAGFFIVFALSLMGVFNLALPPSVVNSLDRRARGIKGPVGVIVMGLAFTATSFTCTVQFVGTLLIAAVGGEIFWPILGMLVFSTVFALPFFLLALCPRYVTAIRGKSGVWLVQVKVVLGIVELLAALKFVSNADLYWQWGFFDRSLLLWAGAGLATLSALVILGLIPWPGIPRQRLNLPRLAWGGLFVAVVVYFVAGVRGVELDAYTESYLPPSLELGRGGGVGADGEFVEMLAVHQLPWHPTLEPALAEARESGKPVFVDFTGYTCINCRWMEKKVFADKAVFEAFKQRFALAQLYTDGGDHAEPNQALQVERFRTLALPYYVILTPGNAVLARHAGIMPNPADFLTWLDQAERRMATPRPQR